jgi:hypothetical protein
VSASVLAIPILITNYHHHHLSDNIIHHNHDNFPSAAVAANVAKNSNNNQNKINYQKKIIANNYPINHDVKQINDAIKSIKSHRTDLKINWIKYNNTLYRIVVDSEKKIVFVKPVKRIADAVSDEPIAAAYSVHEYQYPLPGDPQQKLPSRPPYPDVSKFHPHNHFSPHYPPQFVAHELNNFYTKKLFSDVPHTLGIHSYYKPPNPLLQVMLSHYGRYLPIPQFWGVQGNGLYSYSAGNDLHNNGPNGAYKIVQDYDK